MTTDVSRLVPLTDLPPGGKFLLAKTSQIDPTRRDFALLEPTAVGVGTGTPGGTAGQLQFNDGGGFGGYTMGGDATLDPTTGTIELVGKGSANGPIIADSGNKLPLGQMPLVTRSQPGAAPPPGTGTGITRFFREDLSWGVPPGSAGASDVTFVRLDGSIIPATLAQPYVMGPSDFRILGAASAPMFVVLPTAPVIGVHYIVFSPLLNAATNVITVSAPTGGSINGAALYQQALDGEAIWYMAVTLTDWRLC